MTSGDTGDRAWWGPEIIRPGLAAQTVGRRGNADFPLQHPAVSRRQAAISLGDGGIHLRDLGSRFGTKVNGRKVDACTLNDGDRVEFGPVPYIVRGRQLELVKQLDGAQLQVEDLAIDRGSKRLLSNVNLKIRPNQFVGILGPSGAGKTTLLKCLASILSPASGHVTFDGNDLAGNLESYRAILGYVPQDDVVFGPLSARENLDFALQLRGSYDLKNNERRNIVELALKRLHLTEHADKPVHVLSGGQRKRVNIATELLSRPRVLFLDEPTSGLDPATEVRIMRELKELSTKGTTVVCSTHVMENLGMFDEVVVVAGQTVVYAGPPGNLLARFGLPDFAALYEHLENASPPPTSQRNTATPNRGEAEKLVGVLAGVPLVKTKPQQQNLSLPKAKLAAQVPVQFRRGLRIVLLDRFFLMLLLLQPLLIGFLINLSQVRPNGLEPLFLFAVITCIWLGLNNTAREVVRDRPIYVRERLAGVTPEGYLAAKALLFGAIGLVQIGLLVLMVRHGNFLSPGDNKDLAAWHVLYLTAVFWTTYLAGMFLGLLVSTLASSQETAVAMLPVIVLPQLLLTGVATGLNDSRDGSFRSLMVLFSPSQESSRGFVGWLLETVSMPAYSRPAMCLFQNVRPDQVPAGPAMVHAIDALHLLFLVLLTITLLVVVFHFRERRWLEKA